MCKLELKDLCLFWPRSRTSNIYQNLKCTTFPPEKSSDLCGNIFGQHVTPETGTRWVIDEQRYNNFSSDSIGICSQFEKVYGNAIPTNRISRLWDETISSSIKGGKDCSDVSKCNGR